MLIAQARVAELSLVTADEVAAAYGDSVLLVR
jgi:PIN domain nuclease of toxin-antitoxin system